MRLNYSSNWQSNSKNRLGTLQSAQGQSERESEILLAAAPSEHFLFSYSNTADRELRLEKSAENEFL